MAVIADPEFWLRLFSIGVLNLLLSGDNALVIALAVRALPKRKRVLGQVWGALGAVVLRLVRSEEHTSELQSRENLVCRLLLEKKNKREHTLLYRPMHYYFRSAEYVSARSFSNSTS